MSVDAPADAALLLLRLGVGGVFVTHGIGKLHRRPGLKATARWFHSIGLRPGRTHAILAATTECGVGVLLLAGLLTPAACAGVIGLMSVAIITATGRRGFGAERGGWEYNGVLIVVAGALALSGPGAVSLDSAWNIEARGVVGLVIALTLAACAVGAMQLVQRRTGRPAATAEATP